MALPDPIRPLSRSDGQLRRRGPSDVNVPVPASLRAQLHLPALLRTRIRDGSWSFRAGIGPSLPASSVVPVPPGIRQAPSLLPTTNRPTNHDLPQFSRYACGPASPSARQKAGEPPPAQSWCPDRTTPTMRWVSTAQHRGVRPNRQPLPTGPSSAAAAPGPVQDLQPLTPGTEAPRSRLGVQVGEADPRGPADRVRPA